MLYGSETWCLREREMAILRRTERAMVRAMCGVNLLDKKRAEDLRGMLGIEVSVEQLAKANGVRWYGHVLRRDGDHALRRALEFQVNGARKRGRPKMTWKRQVEEETQKVGLRKEDASNRVRWREGVRAVADFFIFPSLTAFPMQDILFGCTRSHYHYSCPCQTSACRTTSYALSVPWSPSHLAPSTTLQRGNLALRKIRRKNQSLPK